MFWSSVDFERIFGILWSRKNVLIIQTSFEVLWTKSSDVMWSCVRIMFQVFRLCFHRKKWSVEFRSGDVISSFWVRDDAWSNSIEVYWNVWNQGFLKQLLHYGQSTTPEDRSSLLNFLLSFHNPLCWHCTKTPLCLPTLYGCQSMVFCRL